MSDYISRESAFGQLSDWADEYSIGSAALQSIAIRLKKLPAADVRHRWIPTTERLPEEGGTYLCVWQGRKIDTGFFGNGHFRLYGEPKTHLVTHWMPLPELPITEERRGKET